MRARSATTLLCTLGACAALAVSATGCGSGGASVDPVAQAAQTTTHAGGSRMSFTGSVSAPALPSPITFTGSGYFNYAGHEGSLTFSMSGLPAAAQSVLHGSSLHLIELFKGGALYMSSPLFATVSGGRQWVKLDLARVGQAIGLDPSSLTSGGTNPADFLSYLTAAGATTSTVGHEQVRGVATTHYAGSLDLLKAAEAQPGVDRAKVRAAFQQLVSQLGRQSVPIEVWVDSQHLVRRFSMAFDLGSAAGGARATFTADYYDFGPTPGVNVPASSEVLDITGQALTHLPGAAG